MLRVFRLLLLFLSQISVHVCSGHVFNITLDSLNSLSNYRVVLLQFSASWCFFSQHLKPIYLEVSNDFIEETKKFEVLFGHVDCDSNVEYCFQEQINKYPTIKILRYGVPVKREYRGARTVDALTQFVRDQISDNIILRDAQQRPIMQVLSEMKPHKDGIFGIFPMPNISVPHYQHYNKAAHIERDNCVFYTVYNVTDTDERLAYKEALSQKIVEVTTLKEADFVAIHKWISTKCRPVVRELTFETAEEIIAEGLPLLLLFYNENSRHIKPRFYDYVRAHFEKEREEINFVVVDGDQISYPLKQLGKSTRDLPLICIDTLVHIYWHPADAETVFSDPSHLRQFIMDLHSGKLHRELHFGPDSDFTQSDESPKASPPVPVQPLQPQAEPTAPAESVFRKLRPSYLKYTILRDEL